MALSTSSSLLDDTFKQAVATFEASLTEKQRRDFQGCSLQDVEDTMRGIENRLASQRRQRNMRRISKFVEGMTQLGKVVELFVNVDCTVAFIWGPIKFVLLAAGTWVETLDCLLDTYAEIGETLPGLSQYERLLGKHPYIGIHLQRYYCDVLEFHRKALTVFSRPSWKTAFHSSWKTFKTQFGPILAKLKRHRDLLSDEKITAAIAEVQDFRHSIEDKLDDLSRQVEKLHLDDEEESLKCHENLDRKRQFVLSKLEPPDTGSDLERASNERAGSTSGDWLLADTEFRYWSDTASTEHRTLYLNGIPGTGKTILASALVRHLQALQETVNESNRKCLVLYFFFKHCQAEKCTFTALLLALLSQVVLQDEVVLDLLYPRLMQADQRKVRSVSLLRELAELALKVQGVCFIVVDGLDECLDPSATSEAAQGEVIDCLEALTTSSFCTESESGATDPEDRCIRLFIGGQRNGCLEERLRHWPEIQVDSSSAHMADIQTHSEARSLEIQRKFGTDEATRLDIIRRVNSRAKGMFLYAKVVLGNLFRQPTRGHFKRELKEENFPNGLDQAYERVAVQVLEGPDEVQTGLARQILKLVLCAERSLFWKEIQSRFCVEIESETADPDFMLLEGCKKYCGSLVEVTRNCRPGFPPDELVELVHETARTYLLQTGRFVLANLHADMALFCARYLSSAPFNLAVAESDVEIHCLSGYYGFLDYAVANWWRHVKPLQVPLDNAITEAISRLSSSLRPETDSAINSVWSELQRIQNDGREWEDVFPTEDRVKRIRACIEKLFHDDPVEGSTDLEAVRELYGCVSYKCIKPWCHSFLLGFENTRARDDHLMQHERPFRCTSDGCYGNQIGFASESELARHDDRVHHQISRTDMFPSDLATDIFEAAAEGRLDVVQNLVGQGTSANTRNKDDSTPLFLAARAGHQDICRWLLEHGAKVNARCTKRKVTALHAAVVNDDAELTNLLIVDYGVDIYARDAFGKGMASLMVKKRKKGHSPGVAAAFPSSFSDHAKCNAFKCRRARLDSNKSTSTRTELVGWIRGYHQVKVKHLLESALSGPEATCIDPNFPGSSQIAPGFTILHHVLSITRDLGTLARGQEYAVQALLQSGRVDYDTVDPQGNLALHYACRTGFYTVARRLFKLTSFPNTASHAGETPFDILLRCSNKTDNDTDLVQIVDTLSWVLESGIVDINRPDNRSGRCALHQACMAAHPSVVARLLALTKDIDLPDLMGVTPYQYAVKGKDLATIAAVLEHKGTQGWPLTDTERSYVRIMELIRQQDPAILTRSRKKAYSLTLLQCGAFYLSAEIIQCAISLLDRLLSPSDDQLIPHFKLPLAQCSSSLQKLFAEHSSLVRSPFFLAMLMTSQAMGETSTDVLELRQQLSDVANALLLAPSSYIHDALSSAPSLSFGHQIHELITLGDERTKLELLDKCCDSETVRRLAEAGLTLSWPLLRWKSLRRPYDTICVLSEISVIDASGENDRELQDIHTVLSVVCSGPCRFVDIATENFTFARDTLASRRVMPGSLNLDDVEQLVDLISEHPDSVDEMLQSLVWLGLDGERALRYAVEKGRVDLISILLGTRDERVRNAVLGAYDRALELRDVHAANVLLNGHLESLHNGGMGSV